MSRTLGSKNGQTNLQFATSKKKTLKRRIFEKFALMKSLSLKYNNLFQDGNFNLSSLDLKSTFFRPNAFHSVDFMSKLDTVMLENKVSFIMLSISVKKTSTCRMNKQNGCETSRNLKK
jgi:hypothetical protein